MCGPWAPLLSRRVKVMEVVLNEEQLTLKLKVRKLKLGMKTKLEIRWKLKIGQRLPIGRMAEWEKMVVAMVVQMEWKRATKRIWKKVELGQSSFGQVQQDETG